MTGKSIRRILESGPIEASAPCRIDMGGTLDISTFYYPLRHLSPCTVNIAIDLRTRVTLLPFDSGKIRVTSAGFRSATFEAQQAPFDHPLGLIFAIAEYFGIQGIHIVIESSSPPRSALGGSSSAGVALIWALTRLFRKSGGPPASRRSVALLEHGIEASVAGVPCGLQDQLAAVFGGVNAWYWRSDFKNGPFQRVPLVSNRSCAELERHLLLAYCGIPHESRSVNSIWIRQFVSGRHRGIWEEIVALTHEFGTALSEKKYKKAAERVSAETVLRRRMTPQVLDEIGRKLVACAESENCGARFTGAGGGGCIWAVGETKEIEKLKPKWESIVSGRRGARLLKIGIDSKGVL